MHGETATITGNNACYVHRGSAGSSEKRPLCVWRMPVLAGLWRRLPQAAGYQVRNLRHRLQLNTVVFCSTQPPSSDVTVNYRHGLPVITLTLPSRNERCQFTIKPMSTTVGQFIKDIKKEDQGIDTVTAISTDGTKFSTSTLMNTLLMNDFQLIVNNKTHKVHPPPREMVQTQHSSQMDSAKSLVHGLFSALHSEEYLLKKERVLLQRLEALNEELQPLHQVKLNLMAISDAKTTRLKWIGLAYLSTQGGALAWLTWWVYSWDIMEPVTYFITYGSAIAFYSYFLLTRVDYVYPDVRDRQFLHIFYKRAKKHHFDVEKYNKLRNEVTKTEESLRRLRNPLRLKLPVEQLQEGQ